MPHLTWSRFVLIASVAVILGHFREFLFSPAPAGWDTLPQIHLFFKMVKLLKAGTVFGYDLEWFGGFPLFVFYGFAPFLTAAIIHVASFGAIPILFLAKATIIATPILALLAIYLFVGEYFGKEYRFAGLIAFQAYLWYPLSPQMGIGLSGAIHHGLFITLLATALIIFILTALEMNRKTKNELYFIAAILLSAILAFSHIISSAVAALVITTYFFEQGRYRDWIRFSFWVVALSAFCLYPYVRYGDLTNGTKVPSFAYENFINSFIGVNWRILRAPHLNGSKLILECPPLRILLAASFFIGLKKLLHEKRLFLPTLFFIYLFFIASDYMFEVFSATLHYYRFHAFFFIVFLLISTRGLQAIIEWSRDQKSLSPIFINVALILSVVPLILTMPYHGEVIDWNVDYRQESRLMNYIDHLKPTGRVFVERSENEPNPHLFSVFLPMIHHTPVLFGLLIESAENAKFIIPAARTISTTQAWGKYRLPLDNMLYATVVRRIADAGTEYIALHDPASISEMDDFSLSGEEPEIDKLDQVGPYNLYRIPEFLPIISGLRHDPILCVNEESVAGGSNGVLIDQLFKSDLDPDIRIAFYKRKDHPPLAEVMERFKRIILVGPDFSESTVAAMRNYKGEIIVISNDEIAAQKILDGIVFRYFSYKANNVADLISYLTDEVSIKPMQRIEPTVLSDMKIEFNFKGPTVVNIGYFPYWHAKGSPVYRLSPGKILVFADGPTTLTFHLPVAQKGLMVLAVLALIVLIAGARGWLPLPAVLRQAA